MIRHDLQLAEMHEKYWIDFWLLSSFIYYKICGLSLFVYQNSTLIIFVRTNFYTEVKKDFCGWRQTLGRIPS